MKANGHRAILFLLNSILALVGMTACPGTGLALEPIDIGGENQLFCDDLLVAETVGVSRQLNQPESLGPVMVKEHPWEDLTLSYLCVMEDQGLYRMWYGSYEGPTWQDHKRWINYATSDDGLVWTKPRVGLVEHGGTYDNNILPIDFVDGGSIFIDPLAPQGSRYKMLGTKPQPFLYESPDGIDFTLIDTMLLDRLPDTHNQMFYDDRLGTYVAYMRSWNYLDEYDDSLTPNRTVSRVEVTNPAEPWHFDPIDSAFFLFGPTYPAAISTEFDIVLALDTLDPPSSDTYTPSVNVYDHASAYVAFPSIYHKFPPPPEGQYNNDGTLNVQFAYSRDGIEFTRFRAPYVDSSCCGEDTLLAMYMGQGILTVGDYLYQYLYATKETHGDPTKTSRYYCLRQRKDGFVSLDAGMSPGSVRTRSLVFEGNALTVNYKVEPGGYLAIEVRDAPGTPIDGFTIAESDTLMGDDLSATVSWNGLADVGGLAGMPVRLFIEMKDAKLYSIQFTDNPLLDVTELESAELSAGLNQNYPNPFNPETQIEFTLLESSMATLEVFNVTGRKVAILVNESVPSGTHTVSWNGESSTGSPVGSGVYFYRLQANGRVLSRKMLLIR